MISSTYSQTTAEGDCFIKAPKGMRQPSLYSSQNLSLQRQKAAYGHTERRELLRKAITVRVVQAASNIRSQCFKRF